MVLPPEFRHSIRRAQAYSTNKIYGKWYLKKIAMKIQKQFYSLKYL